MVYVKYVCSSDERKGVFMEDHGFHDGGWYPHDGEGKIDSCPGPGCDCDEKNYGSHSSPSNGNVSTFGAILCTVGGLFGAALIFALLGATDPPAILIIIVWAVVATVLANFGGKHGL
jgi:hypothetical protein